MQDYVAGGAPVRVAVANIRKKGEKETEFQWPEGLPANTQYRVRLECRRRGGGILRSDRWDTPVKTA